MSGDKFSKHKYKFAKIRRQAVSVEGTEGYLHRNHRTNKKQRPTELDLVKKNKLNIIKEEEALDEMRLFSK